MIESALVSAHEADGGIFSRVSFPFRHALSVLLVCAGYYAGALIAQSLRFPNSHLSLLWPPTAIVLAALLLAPPRLWWMYLVAVSPVHIFVQLQDGVPALGILSQLIGNFGQALVAAASVRYFVKAELHLDNFRAVIIFTLCAALLAPFLVSGIAAYLYVLSGWEQDYWYAWRARVLSNTLSTLTIIPPILTAFGAGIAKMQSTPPRRYLELGFLMTGLVVAGFLAFGRQAVPTLLYAPLPFLLWAAVRFEIGTLCLALLVDAYLAFLNTSGGQGPFATQSAAENALSVQLFLITISLPLIFLAALTSERREKEQALGRSEARYRALVMASAEIVWRANAQGEAFFFTPSWQQLTGQNDEEMRKVGWLQALHPDDRERNSRLWQQAMIEKRVYENEFRVRTRSGSYRHFHVQAVPLVAPDGTVQEWVGANSDITDRKEAELEAARQRAELAHIARVSTMGELATSVAHELNQPLGAILSNAEAAEMFLDQDPPAIKDVREILVDIRKDDQRASDVIQRMRSLLRKREMELQRLDINELVQDVLKLVGADAALRKTVISANLTPSLPLITGDRVHLQQVLLNLILNGMEATVEQPADTRRLAVCTKKNDNGEVEVAVTDTGHGITRDSLSRVFEPFFTTKRDGMGMGLAISQNIIETHRGRIWAENNPGGGATLRFALPTP